MSEKEQKAEPLMSGTFTSKEMLALIKEMSASNQEAFKEFAKDLAQQITHPEPTTEERERLKQQMLENARAAGEAAELKQLKRRHCAFPANPALPHRRSGQGWGMWNGTTTIAWCYSTHTVKDEATGRSFESQPMPHGVCMWCHSEFHPGDPDYAEALSWGINATAGVQNMDIRSGNWV
jgi:hypothetical protein